MKCDVLGCIDAVIMGWPPLASPQWFHVCRLHSDRYHELDDVFEVHKVFGLSRLRGRVKAHLDECTPNRWAVLSLAAPRRRRTGRHISTVVKKGLAVPLDRQPLFSSQTRQVPSGSNASRVSVPLQASGHRNGRA